MLNIPSKFTKLVQALENVNGMTFIGLDTETEPRMSGGKNNPFKGHVKKIMKGANVMVFQNKTVSGYDNMVKRRLAQEGKDPKTFTLQSRVWGTRIPNTPLVCHVKDGTTKFYLEVIFLKTGEVHYEVDGVKFDTKAIPGLSHTPQEGHQGGLNNKVIIRTFSLDSIKRVRINKEVIDL